MRTILLLVLLAAPLAADTVVCRDGRRIQGKIAEETEAHVKLTVKHGSVTIPRYQIKEIIRGATTEEVYEDRRARTDASDVKALLELAAWCAENGLRKEAAAEYERVLAADPENLRAHDALKHVKQDGRWMTFEEACRARGLVEYDGLWITPEEAKLKQALREKQALEKAIQDKVRDCLRKLASADIAARDEAREQLETIPPEMKYVPLLEGIDSRSSEIRSYCIGALSAYDRPELMPKLARRLLVDESEAIRGIAAESLKKLNHPDTWIQIQKGLQSDAPQVRIRAANALCTFPNENAAEALLNALVRVLAPKGGFSVESREPDPRLAGDPKMTDAARKALENAGKMPGGGMNPLEDPQQKAKEEQNLREKAAIVKALEACTGLAYGDNVDSWREWWLQKHAASAAKAQGGGDPKKEDAPEK